MTRDQEKERNSARNRLLTKSRNVPLMPSLVFGTTHMGARRGVGEGSSSQGGGKLSDRSPSPQDVVSKSAEPDSSEDSKTATRATGKWQTALRLSSKSFKKKTQG